MGKFPPFRWPWAALALLWLQGSTGQAQCPQCPVLSAAISSYPYCDVVNATLCATIRCFVDSWTTSLSMDQCTDPLEISVQINSETPVFSYTFINSSTVAVDGNTTVNFTTSRTASSVSFQVALMNGSVLIPPLTVGLNQAVCMCQSMEALAASVDLPDIFLTRCQIASACSGINCNITVPQPGMVNIDVEFEVCQDPPEILMVVKNSSDIILLAQYFNVSDMVDISVSALITLTLDVFIENYNYSMIIQVTMTANGITSQFFPKQQIILDKSGCDSASTIVAPTTPANQPVSNETCNAVKSINTSSALAELGSYSCKGTLCCDSVVCSIENYTLYTQLLPCNTPPTAFVQGSNPSDIMFEQNLEMMSTAFSIPDLGLLEYIVSSTDNDTRLQVSITFSCPDEAIEIVLVPLQDIPIDRCLCPDMVCSDTSLPLTASTSFTFVYTSTGPEASVSVSPSIEATDMDSAAITLIVVVVVLVVVVLVLILGIGIFLAVLQRNTGTKSVSLTEPENITKADSPAEPEPEPEPDTKDSTSNL